MGFCSTTKAPITRAFNTTESHSAQSRETSRHFEHQAEGCRQTRGLLAVLVPPPPPPPPPGRVFGTEIGQLTGQLG